jgi:hypothetical protein
MHHLHRWRSASNGCQLGEGEPLRSAFKGPLGPRKVQKENGHVGIQ